MSLPLYEVKPAHRCKMCQYISKEKEDIQKHILSKHVVTNSTEESRIIEKVPVVEESQSSKLVCKICEQAFHRLSRLPHH